MKNVLKEFEASTKHIRMEVNTPEINIRCTLLYTDYLREWNRLGWVKIENIISSTVAYSNSGTHRYAEIIITDLGIDMLRFNSL